MDEILKMVAKRMADDGKVLQFKANSVFEAINLPGSTDETANMLANKIAIGLSNDLNFIRQEIIPEVKTFINIMKDELGKVQVNNELTKYNIKEINLPEIINEMKERGMLDIDSVIPPLPISPVSIPVPKEIDKYLKFDSAVLNTLLGEVLHRNDKNFVETVWESALHNVSGSNEYINKLNREPLIHIDEIIVLTAIVGNIKNEKIEGVVAGNEVYVNVMRQFYNKLRSFIKNAGETYAGLTTTGKVIIDYIDEYSAYVHSGNYKRFLNNNGTPEVVLGCIVTQSKYTKLEDLQIHSEELANAWNKKVKLVSIQEAQSSVYRYKFGYLVALEKWYNDVEDDLKPERTIGELKREVENILAKLEADKLLNIEYVADTIFGDIIFPNTGYKTFTRRMKKYLELNNNLTTKEAATLASVEVILDYLLEQVEVRGYNG